MAGLKSCATRGLDRTGPEGAAKICARRTGMSRALLKLSGGSVHDYATISDDAPESQARVTCPESSDERRHIFAPFHPTEPFRGFEHTGGHPAKHHRPTAPALHISFQMARATEQTLDGVCRGQRALETLRQPQAEHGQRLVEAFAHARSCTRVGGVQAPRQVL